jgi:hypothetical protein
MPPNRLAERNDAFSGASALPAAFSVDGAISDQCSAKTVYRKGREGRKGRKVIGAWYLARSSRSVSFNRKPGSSNKS